MSTLKWVTTVNGNHHHQNAEWRCHQIIRSLNFLHILCFAWCTSPCNYRKIFSYQLLTCIASSAASSSSSPPPPFSHHHRLVCWFLRSFFEKKTNKHGKVDEDIKQHNWETSNDMSGEILKQIKCPERHAMKRTRQFNGDWHSSHDDDVFAEVCVLI